MKSDIAERAFDYYSRPAKVRDGQVRLERWTVETTLFHP
jgi:hypothetical protein